MSNSVATFSIKAIIIESLDGSKKVEVSNSLLNADYFEDILSPCVTMRIQLANSSTLFNLLPLRGGEKVAIEIETALGSFYLDGDYVFQ